MQSVNIKFNLRSLWYCGSVFSFSFSLVRTESECYDYIYQFHKGSLADLIGHFLNTVLWKKFSMKRNICPADTSHTYVRKMNRLFSNLWSFKAVNCWHEAIHNVLTPQVIRRQLNIRRDNMDLLTHFLHSIQYKGLWETVKVESRRHRRTWRPVRAFAVCKTKKKSLNHNYFYFLFILAHGKKLIHHLWSWYIERLKYILKQIVCEILKI